MYAIVRTGGKQYQVACGDQVRVEKLEGNVGDSIDLVDVLMVSDGDDVKIGQPVLENAKVTAKIAEQGRGKLPSAAKMAVAQSASEAPLNIWAKETSHLTKTLILALASAVQDASRGAVPV